ncbi:tail fiber protein [Verrucomicrobiaceae bacterium 227]
MSTPFIGEIKIFAGNFAPRGWALCDGQLLAISTNDALFSLLGTIYGGDGRTTFGLPDMRGRVPVHQGSGPGLTDRRIGVRGGQEQVTLTSTQMPAHDHGGRLQAVDKDATTANAAGAMLAKSVGNSIYHTGVGRGSKPNVMNTSAIQSVGGSQSHNNIAPVQCVNFIIALVGIYPSRN